MVHCPFLLASFLPVLVTVATIVEAMDFIVIIFVAVIVIAVMIAIFTL